MAAPTILDVNVQKMKDEICEMPTVGLSIVHLGVFLPEEVLPYTVPEQQKYRKDYTCDNKTWSVKMSSQRYDCFRESSSCVCCGIQGKYMILDQTFDDSTHFNLYAERNGYLILLTKDHIQPSAKGGLDHSSNFQTCCVICNHLKQDKEVSVEEMQNIPSIKDWISQGIFSLPFTKTSIMKKRWDKRKAKKRKKK